MYTNIIHNDDICNYFLKNQQFIFNSLGNCRECRMYGKNLCFKTGGVDGCDCEEVLSLIKEGKIDTTPLITHRFPLCEIEEAYRVFENKLDGVIKVAIF